MFGKIIKDAETIQERYWTYARITSKSNMTNNMLSILVSITKFIFENNGYDHLTIIKPAGYIKPRGFMITISDNDTVCTLQYEKLHRSNKIEVIVNRVTELNVYFTKNAMKKIAENTVTTLTKEEKAFIVMNSDLVNIFKVLKVEDKLYE